MIITICPFTIYLSINKPIMVRKGCGPPRNRTEPGANRGRTGGAGDPLSKAKHRILVSKQPSKASICSYDFE